MGFKGTIIYAYKNDKLKNKKKDFCNAQNELISFYFDFITSKCTNKISVLHLKNHNFLYNTFIYCCYCKMLL